MASNKKVVPEAQQALDKFKMEAANEVGVTLSDSYNGNITSRQAGSVGGQMVKNMKPVRKMKITRTDRTAEGHTVTFYYIANITFSLPE